ncbi:MAG TPA: Xaa-Pro peptidase family protein [Gammaproteobacteria bacterium]|nr:Xaa-Pro peptidase family protein [Gammaproteobacteria bacterium]
MAKTITRYFPQEEYDQRRENVRRLMGKRGLDAIIVSSPENIYYLTGLDHMGYFACQLLVVPLEGTPMLVTRAMERATVRDLVPDVLHFGYQDSDDPREVPVARSERPGGNGSEIGVNPVAMSYGIPSREQSSGQPYQSAAARETCHALNEAGLSTAAIGIERNSSFLPFGVAEAVVEGMPQVRWRDASGLVDDCRIVQSPRELECTREAARLSDSMMLAAQAAADEGVPTKEVIGVIYDVMFRRGGTYPGFVPLVRSTGTLTHEHGTWQDTQLSRGDILFLEMSGCVRRYHAPMGRLVFIGEKPSGSQRIHEVCRNAQEKAAGAIGPGVRAGDVYRLWQEVLDAAGLAEYRRHHCGYSVGIGFPPSWSGSGVPVGLRANSDMELREGMVFHLMSWLLRTGQGDSFLSDTAVVTGDGCEILTSVGRDITVR